MSNFFSFFVIVLLTFSFVSCDEGEDNPYMKDKEDYPQDIQDYCEAMWDCVQEVHFFNYSEEIEEDYDQPWTSEASCRAFMAEMQYINEICDISHQNHDPAACGSWERVNDRCKAMLIHFHDLWLDEYQDYPELRCTDYFGTVSFNNCYPEGYEPPED